MAYATRDEIKEEIGIPEADDAADSRIDGLLPIIKAIIDNYTHRTFEAEADATRYFDVDRDVCGRMLFFDHDLVSITTVQNGDGNTIPDTEYTFEPRNDFPKFAMILKGSSTYYWMYTDAGDAEDAIAITGKWAFAETPPDYVRRVAIRLGHYLYRQPDTANDLGRSYLTVNATNLPSKLPSDIEMILRDLIPLVY